MGCTITFQKQNRMSDMLVTDGFNFLHFLGCAACQQVLPGPEVAARAAAAASSKKRTEAEAAISKAVTDALRLLGLLKPALPLMPGECHRISDTRTNEICEGQEANEGQHGAKRKRAFLVILRALIVQSGCVALCAGARVQEVVGLMLNLYVLRQPMLSRSATECLAALCARSSSISAAALVDVLRSVVHMDTAWDAKDPASLISLINLVESGYIR